MKWGRTNKGRKNGIKFEILSYTQGWSKKVIGYYVMVEDTKIDEIFNSLWLLPVFADLDIAKQWCEDFTWHIVYYV